MNSGSVKGSLVMSQARKYAHARKGLFEMHDPEEMRDCSLRRQLCIAGPEKCAECGMCAYGREWVRRGLDRKQPEKAAGSRGKTTYQRRKEAGLCTHCGQAAEDGFTTCFACRMRERQRLRMRENAYKYRRAMENG